MKIKFLSALYLFATFCLFTSPVLAADIKIGVINTTKIISDSKAGKIAKSVLTKEIEEKQTEFTAKQKELQAMKDEITSKEKEMAASVYSEKTAKFSLASKELSRMKSDMEDELKTKENELGQKILLELSSIVSDFCKKEKYTIILEKKNVAAFDSAVDITDKIIQLYDAAQIAAK
jgi:outer membrane protein